MQKDIESIEKLPAPEVGSDAYYRQNPEEAVKRAREIQGEVGELNKNIEDFYMEAEGVDITADEFTGIPFEFEQKTATTFTVFCK